MVKHIVLYTLKEGVDKTEAVKLIAFVLEPLVGKIPGLLHLGNAQGSQLCVRIIIQVDFL